MLIKPITFGPGTASGTSSATDATSLTDSGASFTAHALIGLTVYSNGKSAVVTENDATSVTVGSWTGGTPTAVKTYMIGSASLIGPIGTFTIGTISSSGIVIVRLVTAICSTDLTGATATLALGVTGSTQTFLTTTTATTIDANQLLGSGGFAAAVVPVNDGTLNNKVIRANIIGTVATENILTGTISFTIYWDPISSGATLT